mgnify:CR=1 FL=1
MKYFTFFFCFFFISNAVFSQNKALTFPENAVGIYKGDIHISSDKGNQIIPMELHLKATRETNKFEYVLVYNKTPRNYSLVVKNKEKGLYEIDENNGIILPAKFANNTLFSFFEVQGNLLSSRLAFYQDRVEFEILFAVLKNKLKTGGNSKDIPEVFGYPISTVQKAVLKRKN